jgi:flavin reductase (DIM6/NTAB) family NADH-FMN oxidoreductase RutF
MFSANQTETGARKDTTINVEQTGCFVWNMATYALREAVNISSEQVSPGEDEFLRAGLSKGVSECLPIAIPTVADSPIKFECTYHSTIRLPGNPPMGTVDIIIGKVIGVHISDDSLTDGMVDLSKIQPIARCGYYEYAVVKETFEMVPPGGGLMKYGLEGSAEANREEGKKTASPVKK